MACWSLMLAVAVGRPHRDDRVQRMAECFLESFMEKRNKQEVNPGGSELKKCSP